ncbi:hypothetical protein MFUL124B02_21195 [Myxococcus fulvus 124B02]|nr:hypothetical protein MFUL124B02_21195 [Myxococcus fulvus 124B02]
MAPAMTITAAPAKRTVLLDLGAGDGRDGLMEEAP